MIPCRSRLLALTVVGLAILGIGVLLWPRDPAGEPAAVSFGYIPIVDGAPLYVALEEGLFARRGIEPAPRPIAGGPLILETVAGGHLDVGFANTTTFLQARAAGVPLLPIGAVSVVDRERVRAALLVRPDSPVRAVSDLAGRTIAVNASGNVVELALRKLLARSGVASGTVRFVVVPFPQMEAALRAGRVDAIPLSEPFWTFAESRGDLRMVADFLGEAWPVLEIAAWFTTRDWIEQNPRVARSVDRALRDAVAFLRNPANETRVRDIIARYTGIDSATAARIRLPAFQAHFTRSHLDEVIADMREHGFLSGPLETGDLLSGSPIEAR